MRGRVQERRGSPCYELQLLASRRCSLFGENAPCPYCMQLAWGLMNQKLERHDAPASKRIARAFRLQRGQHRGCRLGDFSSFSLVRWSPPFMDQPWRLVGMQRQNASLDWARGGVLDVPARGDGSKVLVGRNGRAGQTQRNPEQTPCIF